MIGVMERPVYYLNDSESASTGALARTTFRLFWREMSWEHRRIIPAYGIACVKVAFEQQRIVEHMWVNAKTKRGKTALTLARVLHWPRVEATLVTAGGAE
jgi:uncharacterized protein YegJ (DUF2314 family)